MTLKLKLITNISAKNISLKFQQNFGTISLALNTSTGYVKPLNGEQICKHAKQKSEVE